MKVGNLGACVEVLWARMEGGGLVCWWGCVLGWVSVARTGVQAEELRWGGLGIGLVSR